MKLWRTIIGELKRRTIQFLEVVWYICVITILLLWILPDLFRRKRK